ncbi:MAG: DNA gyrase inhibitor YacG [Terriglobales bacterium]
MPRKRARSLRCPTCRKLVLRADPEFPFCSERCRLIDLGKWASGGYVISDPINQGDQFGEADYTVEQGRLSKTDGVGKHDDNDRKRS